jgi:hypothetical protein
VLVTGDFELRRTTVTHDEILQHEATAKPDTGMSDGA